MQYLDGDAAAGEQLKYSTLGHAAFAGGAIGIAKIAGGAFSKALGSKGFGPALQNLGESIGGYFAEAFAGTPGGFEGAIRLINRVSPSSGKMIAGFIGEFGSGFAKSLDNAYYSGSIKGAVMEREQICEISGTLDCLEHLSEYEFDASVQDYSKFGRAYLAKNLPADFDVSLLAGMDVYDFGSKILEQTGGKVTSYGVVSGRGQSLYSALTMEILLTGTKSMKFRTRQKKNMKKRSDFL